MARGKQNQQTPPAAADEAVQGEQAAQETTAAEEQTPPPDAGEGDQQTPPAAGDDSNGDPDPDSDPEPTELVKALVLHDSVYGKCGEVKEFPADQVEAIRAGGYIDPHPNAVKSAEA